MNGYLLSVIGTVLIAALFTAIAPEGKTSGLIKAIAKSACLLAIVAPIPSYLHSGNSDEKNADFQTIFSQTVIETDEDFIKYYSEMRIRATAQALEAKLKEKFSVETSVELQWTYDSGDIKITNIIVKTENGEENTAMWEYLTKNYCSEVMIE